jgi:hypothetical protein
MDKTTLERLDDDDWYSLKRKPLPLSAETLLKLGRCCGNKCLNCPYKPKHTIGNENIHFDHESQIPIRQTDGGGTMHRRSFFKSIGERWRLFWSNL